MNNTLHLLWCTIRPNVFIKMHNEWITKIGNTDKNIKTHVAVNTLEDSIIIEEYLKLINHNYRIIIVETKTIGVCYPSYKLSSTTDGSNGDIVVFASDDFYPPNNWLNYLFTKTNNLECGLMVNDGYQLVDSSNMLHPVITIPILTWGCFEQLNKIIYHPAYSHMFSDAELYNNLKDLNLLYDDRVNDQTMFEHLHYAAGKRNSDNNDRIYSYKWKDDEQTWNNRKVMTIEKRLEI